MINRSDENMKTVLAAAATYVGTVVGAGFASGQEVLQFFGLLGPNGLLGILFASFGFYFFGSLIMDLGRQLQAKSHLGLIRAVGGSYLSPILDYTMTFFLFGALSAMIAGAGAVFEQEFNVPWIVGAVLMAALSLVTVLFGLKGIIIAISAVVPFLMGSLFLISIAVLAKTGLHIKHPPPSYPLPFMTKWPLAGYTYVSYNTVMAVPVLAVLGATMKTKKGAHKSSFLGALILGAGLLLVFLTLVSTFPQSLQYEIPMIRLALAVHPLGKSIYTMIFLSEVYTTAVADLFGFSARICPYDSPKFLKVAITTAMCAIVAAKAGFTNLVRFFYPVVGWMGSLFLFLLLLNAKRGAKN